MQHVRPVSKTLAEEEKRGETLGGQDGRLVFSPTLSTFLLQLFLSRAPTVEALLFKKDIFFGQVPTFLLPQKRLKISGELQKIVAAAEIFGLNSITLQG